MNHESDPQTFFKRRNRFQIKILIVLCFFLITLTPLASAGEQKEMLKVKDALCCYSYNPEPPHAIKPLFIGDTVPANHFLYLPDLSSRLILEKEEGSRETVFKEPGVYDGAGKKLKLPVSVKNLISQKGESCQAVKFDAERMIKEEKSPGGSLELDDPQRVPSPST